MYSAYPVCAGRADLPASGRSGWMPDERPTSGDWSALEGGLERTTRSVSLCAETSSAPLHPRSSGRGARRSATLPIAPAPAARGGLSHGAPPQPSSLLPRRGKGRGWGVNAPGFRRTAPVARASHPSPPAHPPSIPPPSTGGGPRPILSPPCAGPPHPALRATHLRLDRPALAAPSAAPASKPRGAEGLTASALASAAPPWLSAP